MAYIEASKLVEAKVHLIVNQDKILKELWTKKEAKEYLSVAECIYKNHDSATDKL